MISDLDIWRSAKVMVKQCGVDASLESAKRADELLEAGDTATYQRSARAASIWHIAMSVVGVAHGIITGLSR